MDYIEYIQIFISLVLGMAFTRIITSYAVIIKNAKSFKFYWPYFPFSIGLLIFVINDFWTGFERSKLLTVGSGFDLKLAFMNALIPPLCYTIVAELLHPTEGEDKAFDLKQIVVTGRKTAYVLGALSTGYAMIISLIFAQISTTISAQLIRPIILTVFIIGIFSKNESVQKCIAAIFFLMAIAWFLFENTI